LVRAQHERDGLRFLEVFVNTPSEECVRRDPKGLYARANSGNLSEMTGVDAPYEAPRAPEVELTPEMDIDAATTVVLAALGERPQSSV
jgi:adenylylsulfate kinase-like enzyme